MIKTQKIQDGVYAYYHKMTIKGKEELVQFYLESDGEWEMIAQAVIDEGGEPKEGVDFLLEVSAPTKKKLVEVIEDIVTRHDNGEDILGHVETERFRG